MKIILILVVTFFASCESKHNTDLENAKELIKKENKKLYDDSISIDRRMRIEIAKELAK